MPGVLTQHDILLLPAGRVAGIVTEGGQPVQAAWIYLDSPARPVELTAYTGQDGRFMTTWTRAATYTVTCAMLGHPPLVETIEVRAGQTTAVTCAF
jgi:hypothetical protein